MTAANSTGRGRRSVTVLCALLGLALAACGGDGGGGGGGADTTAADPGCKGLSAGTWVSGEGSAGAGADKFVLEVGGGSQRLDIKAGARDGGTGADAYLTVYVSPSAENATLMLSADGRELRVDVVETSTRAAIAGDLFDEVNNGFGGLIVEGRFCFDRVPVSGTELTGSWVFLLSVGAAEKLYRIQGSFRVPGVGVAAGTSPTGTPTLQILTGDQASLTVD